MIKIYPIAKSIIESQTASERDACEFLGFARSPFQRWKQFELSSLEQEDKAILPLVIKVPFEWVFVASKTLVFAIEKTHRNDSRKNISVHEPEMDSYFVNCGIEVGPQFVCCGPEFSVQIVQEFLGDQRELD